MYESPPVTAVHAVAQYEFKTVLDALIDARREGGSTAGITLLHDRESIPDETRSYTALLSKARAYAQHFMAMGVEAGDRVLIVLPTSFEYVLVFFAVQLAGAIPVPVYPPATLERADVAHDRLTHVARHSGAAHLVTSWRLSTLVGAVALRAPGLRKMITVEQLEADAPAHHVLPDAVDQSPAFIQYTSGSTGSPKGVLLTHANLVANLHAIGQSLQVRRGDVVVSWLPLYHDMGLIGALLFAVYWQLPLVLMSPSAFLRKPQRWLDAISRYRGTLNAAPSFAFALCNRRVSAEELARLDLSSWRSALNGAEPIHAGTLLAFRDRFACAGFRATTMCPVYGLAEASLAVTLTPQGQPPRIEYVEREALAAGLVARANDPDKAVALVSVGRVVPGHELRVVDATFAPLPEDAIGEICVRGPSVMHGYFNDAAATSEVLVDGWLRTGDLGYVSGGHLFVTGRAKDLIIVRGRNYYPQDIEACAEHVPGIRVGCSVAFGLREADDESDRVVVICETDRTAPEERKTLTSLVMTNISEHVGLSVHQVILAAPGVVPKTSSGKRQRRLAKKNFLDGNLTAPTTSTLGAARLVTRSLLGFAAVAARRAVGS